MESSSPRVPFPLLQAPAESTYRACTMQYRFPSDDPRKATPLEIQWIDLYLKSVPSFKQRAESDTTVPDAPAKAEKFAQRYTSILEEFKKNPESHGGPPDCIDEENAKAMSLFEGVVRRNDEIENNEKRAENLIRGILAGNIFDLGSAQAVIFVDNSGADIILGILPFARELLRRGTKVILAANDMPSINDVTYLELVEIINKLKDENGKLAGVDVSDLLVVNSGNDMPVIDLSRVSPELAYMANDADLVVLEGNVKHLEVAQFFGGRLYDCVFKFNEA
ncbi:hypothetical protein ACQ4PT_021318 [Festuca glaucescens]